jgi:RHS repeat-associated protein
MWLRVRIVVTALAMALSGMAQAATPGNPIEMPKLVSVGAQFEEPLVPAAPTTRTEDTDLLAAIAADRAATEAAAPLEDFVRQHQGSGWLLAVLTNLGLRDVREGYFQKALSAFEAAWNAGAAATEPHARALADRAVGELLRMHVRLGHVEQVAALLAQLKGRGLTGRATELRANAKQALWVMRNNPGLAYRCGPIALQTLLHAAGVPAQRTHFLDRYRAGPRGTTLAELDQLATQAGFAHHTIHRGVKDPVPVPSLVHWTTNHFATLLSERNGRYEVADPAVGPNHLWVTRAVLDSETSGYFLVPGAAAAEPWRLASAAETAAIYGSGGPTNGSNNTDDKSADHSIGGNSTCHLGMCGYSFTEMLVSLHLADTPVGYAPPIGPPVFVTLSYNQREASQPANFSYFNISPKWSLNWLAYIVDDPAGVGTSVSLIAAGGGSVDYTYNTATNAFNPEIDTGAILSIVNPSFNPEVPRVYKRTFPDGTVETYSVSNNATAFPRYLFLSSITDPSGNSVQLNYDGKFRLLSIVDATGRSTKFAYGDASNPLLVTAISDPFGRTAKLVYDSSGRLHQSIDVLGLTSQYDYDASSLVNMLTTPYGVTNFSYADGDSAENGRYLMATDPLGNSEYLQFNQGVSITGANETAPAGFSGFEELPYYNTCYWDKHAYAIAPGDCTQAHITHWTHGLNPGGGEGSMTANTIGSTKLPLEGRIWFNYPGQSEGYEQGALNKPTYIGRILDDGSSQVTTLAYNGLANPTSVVDPVGRTTTLTYAPNAIDVLAVQQATVSGLATIASYTYNAQHEPLTYTDAAGQTTIYSYNTAGQIQSVTDALGETTRFGYNTLGYLTGITNANGKTAASFTYDSFGRVATRTDSEGWTVSYTYDALDRVTQETYPDRTTRVYTYKYLDLYSVKDRQNRTTVYIHDAVRNLTSITDPLKNVTKFGYYENGALKSLTDPNGNVTTWSIDVQGRVTGKTYADGTIVANAYENTTSRLHAVTDALGQTKQFSYGLDDQLTGIAYLNAVNATPSVAFTYDPYFPRLTSMTDGSGTTGYSYGAVGALGALKLAIEAPPFANAAINYAYDALGRVIARNVGGDVETVTYDAIGRVTTHTDDIGAFRRSYLGQTGQLTQQTNGFLGTRWLYDTNHNDRRLTNIINSPVASAFSYTTTPEYDISAIDEVFGGDSWKYAYDLADRLTGAASSLGNSYLYGYDFAGNLNKIQTPSGTTTITPNALNQVASAGGTAFTYDANGNLLQDYARTYAWDAENRLLAIGYLNQPGQVTRFKYDGLGRRIAIDETKSLGTSETRYGWCGETLCQARTSTDSVVRRYIAEGEEVVGAGALYYSSDHLGSVRDVIVAQNGLRAKHYDYAPYGAPSTSVGSQLTWTDFRYAGLFYHQTSGLYLATNRAYDAATGRWMSRDPIMESGSVDLYSYVNARALSRIDPLGLRSELLETIAGIFTGLADKFLNIGWQFLLGEPPEADLSSFFQPIIQGAYSESQGPISIFTKFSEKQILGESGKYGLNTALTVTSLIAQNPQLYANVINAYQHMISNCPYSDEEIQQLADAQRGVTLSFDKQTEEQPAVQKWILCMLSHVTCRG